MGVHVTGPLIFASPVNTGTDETNEQEEYDRENAKVSLEALG